MQSKSNSDIHNVPNRTLKQVKVDNWGSFFLQRLLQLYFNEELLDINIKFHSSNNVLKVHRLVIATCTDYFLQLERDQSEKNETNNGYIVMPSDMSYECVKAIISFIYTGQLEYWTSEHNDLYRTAQKMNITVLTKLLDAQWSTHFEDKSFAPEKLYNESSIVTLKQAFSNINLPETGPSQIDQIKKSSVCKRKLNQSSLVTKNHNLETYHIYNKINYPSENMEGPSRFDLPEIDELTLGVFSSFDDITYNTKPIIQAPEKIIDERNIKFSAKTGSELVLQFNSNDNYIKLNSKMSESTDEEWIDFQSNLQFKKTQRNATKKIRFDVDENISTNQIKNHVASSTDSSEDSINNHAKIVREVLKKYPHLVQNNKNIKLKIMQKEPKNTECLTSGKTKISYLVLKPDSLMINNIDDLSSSKNANKCFLESNEIGPWKCSKCDLDEHYSSYYMYRRHMQDVHCEKFDPRICEHCGYKATKRNILMYHMYTKHNVAPPKSMSFPKCQICSYVALSDSLLVRHQINHKQQSTHNSEHSTINSVCYNQNKMYLSDSNEVNHYKINDNHNKTPTSKKEKNHYCSYCGKYFVKVTNLKVHINYHHKNLQKLKSATDISAVLKKSLESSTFIPSGADCHLDVYEELIQAGRKNKIESTPNLNNISTCEVKFEQQQMIMPIDNKKHYRSLQCPYPYTILKNDEMVVPNSNENTTAYMHQVINNDFSNGCNANEYDTGCDDYQHLHDNNTRVKNLYEKLESKNAKQVYKQEHRKFNSEQTSNKEKNSTKNYLNMERFIDATIKERKEEVLQYIEEETEILEYETCNNI